MHKVGSGVFVLTAALLAAAASRAADEPPTNAVAALEAKLEKGEVKLAHAADGHGYLKSLLQALAISPDSQVLPFTRSSLQFDKIDPKAPRAIYFNDDVAVGAVHAGGLIEIIANDRRGELAFYTMEAGETAQPRLVRENGSCVACHGMVNTVTPGWIVANIIATADGMPQIANPAYPFDFTDQTRPFENRWGGWYVTGATQNMRHQGNVTAPDPHRPFDLPEGGGPTLASLADRFDLARTLRPTSDIVALMTLEHQTGFINRIFTLKKAYSDKALDDLVAYMTFASEVPLPGPVSGNSGFTTEFAKRGPQDQKGRSLRTFDLKTRLFRYPLSYMIYSNAFDALDPDLKAKLYQRLRAALVVKGTEGADTIAILAATKPDAPADWKQ